MTYRKIQSFIAKLPKFCNIKIETFIKKCSNSQNKNWLSVVHWYSPCVKKNCQLIFGPVKKRFRKVSIWTKYTRNFQSPCQIIISNIFLISPHFFHINFYSKDFFKEKKKRNAQKNHDQIALKLIEHFQSSIRKTVNVKRVIQIMLFPFEIMPIDVTFKTSESKIQNFGGKSFKSQYFSKTESENQNTQFQKKSGVLSKKWFCEN